MHENTKIYAFRCELMFKSSAPPEHLHPVILDKPMKLGLPEHLDLFPADPLDVFVKNLTKLHRDCSEMEISITVWCEDAESAKQLFELYLSFHKTIMAAGGIVKNANGNILLIYRRGFWGLAGRR